jgi:hypothetical protein
MRTLLIRSRGLPTHVIVPGATSILIVIVGVTEHIVLSVIILILTPRER